MGNLVETGLGWYLDEDYLITLGNQVIGTVGSATPSYPEPSLETVYRGPFSNMPVSSPGFYIEWFPDFNAYLGVYQSSNVGTARYWCFYVRDASSPSGYRGYNVTDVSGTKHVSVRSTGGVAGEWPVTPPMSGYPGYYSDNWVDPSSTNVGNVSPNFLFNTLDEAMQIIMRSSQATVKKVQGGAGAFAFVSYPHGGSIVHVGVGISSIPNPNSAATVAVNDVNGNYTTFNREGMQFTMYYTSQETGTLTANVPEVVLDNDISVLPGLYEFRLFLAVANAAQVHVGHIPADEDPYAPGGTSQPSDGTPDFTETSESISPGSTFPISFQSTGLCRVYVPSITDLNDLASYLWTDQTFLDTIKNILINQFENFMEAVISLTMVPCQVPKGTAQPVKVMFLPTGLSFPPATQQFVEVDCGYVDITERYASALDYNPYTKVSLYLPFIGTVPLDTDEVMGHRVKCVYTIDVVSGACVAKIMVDYPDSSNGVLYQFSGHCSISMPLTAADFSGYYAAAMSGLKMASGIAAAGAGAPGLAGTLLGEPTAHPSSTTTVTRTTARNAATGRQILSGTESTETSHTPGQASFKELATRASVNTVGAVINSKFSVEHSGGFTGNTGFLGVQAPYIIITRPDMCNPDEYGAYNGRPSMMYLYLGNLSGFTQVQNIKLTGIPATNPELGEIAELLKTGVIL